MTHRCPGPACTEQAGHDQLMCPRHWYLVPKPMRRALYIAWSRGTGAGSPAHQAAMRAAIAAVNRTSPSSHPEPAASFPRAQLRAGASSPSSNLTRGPH